MTKLIDKAIELGMEKVDYEADGLFYVASYYFSEDGQYRKTTPRNDTSLTLEFSEDLGYAQVFWENKHSFEQISVEKCLELVESMNKVSEMFESLL